MDSVYLPLAVDNSYQPLPVEKQLAVALVKAAPKNIKIKKAILIGWPLLLVKHEKSGGYIIFDETLNIETKLEFIILQDYKRILDGLENNKNDSEILAILKSFRWKDIKGKEEEIFKGVIIDDISPILSYGSPELPLRILDKILTQVDIDSIITDINQRESLIKENINKINDVESKINTILTIIKGKRAEERKQIEDKYNSIIQEKNELLKKTLVTAKKNLESELLNEATKLYSKMIDIEVLIGKAELDYEANPSFQKDLENITTLRSRYLSEIQSKLSEIKNKYRIEIRNMVHEIESLTAQKQKELESIDVKIRELDELQKNILNQLENIKSICNNELERIRMFTKRAPFDKDTVEVILPFLLVVDIYNNTYIIPPQIYNNNKKSTFFGFFRRDPSEISDNMKINLTSFMNIITTKYVILEDNMRDPHIKSLIEKGLEELYADGWGIRRSISEYYV
ncbi:hypothetical protein EWF20_13025 [Sulfolobus sp. S-194]|uniref:hypothetical protein n=1 Tax=Sulfolobus sp. S-194 TaxID=2512240 RepID=UPI0014372A64|nr:hypothetical protein [Sulfolobus sp. S-194]QIW24959.1 hypothetical protein EWF20_13025 [Sulfolobus sp. S-194]